MGAARTLAVCRSHTIGESLPKFLVTEILGVRQFNYESTQINLLLTDLYENFA